MVNRSANKLEIQSNDQVNKFFINQYIIQKILFIIFFTCLISFFSYSQAIPNVFKKTVVFLFIKDKNDKIIPNGTGFFVSKSDSINKISFVYLITAKHVIQEESKNFYNKIYVRINKRNSGFDTIPLELIVPNKSVHFVIDEDQSIDIAVIPLAPDIDKYNYIPIEESVLFKTKDEFDSSYAKEGSNVFYCGLFSPYLGYRSNNPIIRFGRIAMLPTENISWDSSTVKQDLFLVETTTYGGNSGSPLFCYDNPQKIGGGMVLDNTPIKLAGIIKGYSGEKTPVEYVQTSMNLTYTSNIGITAVIPSYLLYKILESKILISSRESILKNLKK